MANEENLTHFTSDQSREEAVRNGKKGGIASGKARRKKKEMREELIAILEEKITDSKGKKVKIQRSILLAQVKEALKGKTKAAEFIRDTIGEKPADKQEIVNTQPQIIVASQADADLLSEIANVKTDANIL